MLLQVRKEEEQRRDRCPEFSRQKFPGGVGEKKRTSRRKVTENSSGIKRPEAAPRYSALIPPRKMAGMLTWETGGVPPNASKGAVGSETL